MVRLGAVTAAAVEPGKAVTAAFQGQVLNRPSGRAGEMPVKEALLVQYAGVYAPRAVGGAARQQQPGRGAEARLRGRPAVDRERRAGRAGRKRAARGLRARARPGTYRFSWTTFDAEGTWRWRITATDDQNRQSVAERPFLVDYTLSALKVPGVAHELKVGFALSRPASVVLQIETKDGALVAKLPPASLAGGDAVAHVGRHDDERREGAARVVRGAGRSRRARSGRPTWRRRSRCGGSRLGEGRLAGPGSRGSMRLAADGPPLIDWHSSVAELAQTCDRFAGIVGSRGRWVRPRPLLGGA